MSTSYKFAKNIVIASGTSSAQSKETARKINIASYERDTLAALDAIWQGSWTGTSIIQAIAELRGINVIITPFSPGQCNASSDPEPKWASANEINIEFLPSTWQAGSKCAVGPFASPDAVLLHELVHAFRQMNGYKMKTVVNVPGFVYENDQEFYAILLTNIHLSAKGERTLRRDHTGDRVLYPELSTSRPFLTTIRKHRELVHEFLTYKNHYNLYLNHIRKDQCPFNPIDYFMKNSAELIEMNKKKAPPMSAQDLAERRLQEEDLEKKIIRGAEKR